MAGRGKSTALRVTFCGMTAALGAVIMLAGGFLAVLTYAAPLVAAIFLIPVLREFGKGYALLAWAATAVLTVLVSPDKELAFFYVFIGYYPVLREVLGRIGPRLLRIALKLVFFASAVSLMYLFLVFVLGLEGILNEIGEMGRTAWLVSDAVLVLLLMVWDAIAALSDRMYTLKLRPKLKFLK